MFQQNWVLLLIAILALSNGQGSDPKQGPSSEMEKLARAKLEAARRTFDGIWAGKEWAAVEIPYNWSRRCVEAQRLVSDKSEDWVAASQLHLDRMKDLEKITRNQFAERIVGVEQVNAAEYFVAEAAEWLARAKAEHQKSVKKR